MPTQIAAGAGHIMSSSQVPLKLCPPCKSSARESLPETGNLLSQERSNLASNCRCQSLREFTVFTCHKSISAESSQSSPSALRDPFNLAEFTWLPLDVMRIYSLVSPSTFWLCLKKITTKIERLEHNIYPLGWKFALKIKGKIIPLCRIFYYIYLIFSYILT